MEFHVKLVDEARLVRRTFEAYAFIHMYVCTYVQSPNRRDRERLSRTFYILQRNTCVHVCQYQFFGQRERERERERSSHEKAFQEKNTCMIVPCSVHSMVTPLFWQTDTRDDRRFHQTLSKVTRYVIFTF